MLLGFIAKPQFALLSATVMISTAAPLFRQIDEIGALLSASLRLLVAGVILIMIKGFQVSSLSRKQVRAASICGLCYAVHFGTWVSSLQFTTIAASVTLVTTTPILILIYQMANGKRIPMVQGLSTIVALIGVGMIAGADWQVSIQTLWGDVLAILGAVAMAVYFLIAHPLGTVPLIPFMTISALVGGVSLLGASYLFGTSDISHIDTKQWFFLIALAVGPHLIGHGLLTWSLRHATPNAVAIATVGEPAGAAFLAYLVFGETLTSLGAVGCVVTLAAVFIGIGWSKKN